ncbi:MAG: hypothetical protein Q9222_001109 [Ikaeria aurantiellina]
MILGSTCKSVGQPQGTPTGQKNSYRWQQRHHSRQRNYATAQESRSTSSSGHDESLWPELPTPSAVPTPYQIFQASKMAPYSKRRYYELVKLYHPDRHQHCCNIPHIDCLSSDTKMKRYRLVVAANDILSDPSRRKAYDLWGAGWNSNPDIGGLAYNWDSRTKTRWSGFHDNASPAGNATWEDWEKWYRRDSRDHQPPVFCSNGQFMALVSSVVLLSAIWQASRVDEHQKFFAERGEEIHQDCTQTLQQRRNETRELSSSDQAILRFVRAREHGGIAFESALPDSEPLDPQDRLPP